MLASPVLLLAAALLGQPAPVAASPAPDQHPAEVRRLVRRLDAGQLAEREKAEQELIALGPAVLPWLPAAEATASAEVRQRLGRIRQQFEQRMAQSSARATTVTLPAQSMPLSAVLAEIARQTGNTVRDTRPRPPSDDPQIPVRFENTSFWQALDTLLDQSGLDVYPYARQSGLSLVTRTVSDYRRTRRAVYTGPFRIEPTTVDARSSLRDPASGVLRVTLDVSWEPRVHPISVRQRLADLDARDERGRPLLPTPRPQGELEATILPLDTTKEFQIPLPLPPRDVRRIASLKGRLNVLLPGRQELFRFGDLAKARNVEKRIAGATVTLQDIARNGPSAEVRILVRFDQAAGALESYRGWIFQNETYLADPQGRKIQPGPPETTRQSETEIGLAYAFHVPGSLTGYQFVYQTPVSILATGFDYELREIELP